jgi:hypothetical protein
LTELGGSEVGQQRGDVVEAEPCILGSVLCDEQGREIWTVRSRRLLTVVTLSPMNPIEPVDTTVTVTDDQKLDRLVDQALASDEVSS